jgi:hypothetical protein
MKKGDGNMAIHGRRLRRVPASSTHYARGRVGPVALDVLDSLAKDGGWLSTSQIGDELGKPHIRTTLVSLRRKGYLSRRVRSCNRAWWSITQLGRDRLSVELARGRPPGVSAREFGRSRWRSL